MEIKICGMKSKKDIDYANALNPEYVGFILAPSKRQINIELCKELSAQVKEGITKVGVFVNSSRDEVNEIMGYCSLDIAQLHGEESAGYCREINNRVWKVFRVKDKESLIKIEDYKVEGYLFDTFSKEHQGGTGESFSWDIIDGINCPGKIILAGGINSGNIKNISKYNHIQCIDVSSGVEIDGHKDYFKMKDIIERVRGFE